ncbi:type IV toxin-antitoxin system AbiEi family antitoxin domain-containing protein [Ornithinimicrobium cerasi]|uniref:type IV toxin-antitoxin system AbiEi family antitoxin domain-containing protein n=1 Tax=Ornithinimicrobium cerasi TaxID=2248773 RepID=UPI000EFEA930|nr:type IV toxin-antitoxin system AbiEi family antitoxin domain-containing protein [Ornithinimicrobium cerasi]
MSADPWTEAVVPLLAAQDSLVTSTQLRHLGVSAEVLRRWVGAGDLVRLRRNVLVDGTVWRAAPPWERHLIRARGVMMDRQGGPPVALSHHSAMAVMGLSIHGVDDLVHLVTVGGTQTRRRGGLVQHACVGEGRVTDAFGLPTVMPAVACVQVAAQFGVEPGVVGADSALRLGLCRREDLEALGGWRWLGRGRTAASIVIGRADGRHESAGESRTAWVLHRLGYRDVRPQVSIVDGQGRFVARVDFLVGPRVVVEFDGMLKYASPADLTAEKRREDRLRSLGYEVVRLTWADLARPEVVHARIQAALARARTRAG